MDIKVILKKWRVELCACDIFVHTGYPEYVINDLFFNLWTNVYWIIFQFIEMTSVANHVDWNESPMVDARHWIVMIPSL